MGEDFNFQEAWRTYENMDKLIKYFNENLEKFHITLKYSTPSLYLEEINKIDNMKLGVKTDDFFPYAHKPNTYWSGYYTSRVALKVMVRDLCRYFQHSRNFLSIKKITQTSPYLKNNEIEIYKRYEALEQILAILQHHDGVTGTQKQYVADDYILMLTRDVNHFNEHMNKLFAEDTKEQINESPSSFVQCYWNVTSE